MEGKDEFFGESATKVLFLRGRLNMHQGMHNVMLPSDFKLQKFLFYHFLTFIYMIYDICNI
jgi:hypothetical protein